eukprot:CAMPEP_0172153988 /NCGR_PEP_ID=MMETSP1050-20130122/1771_1 /TAXON_ID=233186 /ORGANISM="Cryptomonas curvata, Strain CCAP979/52" /LENGTH=153 /DNA_ID=CAMNT_0012822627 /DNA_START=422 /DNA_END=884 /DNA_ORIENTATION=-
MFLAGVGEPSGRAFHRAFHVPGPVLVPARRSAWVDDLRSCFIVGWRPEPCPACSRSGVAFWVAYPERPGAGRMCAPGVPWPTQVWVPGRDTPVRDSGPVGVSALRDPPQGRPPPRSRARGVLRVSLRVRVPVKGCLGGQVPRAEARGGRVVCT